MSKWKLIPVEPTPEMIDAGARQVDWYSHNARDAYAAMIAAAPEPDVEPVAWLHPENASCVTTVPTAYAQGIPLYTAPQPAKRQPLTDEEIDALALPPSGTATVRDLVRLIERAHGITGESK